MDYATHVTGVDISKEVIDYAKSQITTKDKAITRYSEELYSVYTSRSWRYTAPLRKIVSTIRNILQSRQALIK